MTHNAADDDLRVGGDYMKLEECGAGGGARWQAEASAAGGGGWWWAKLVLVMLFGAVLGAVFLKWIGPFFMDKGKTCIFISLLVWIVVFLGPQYWWPESVRYRQENLTNYGILAYLLFVLTYEIIPIIIWGRETFSPTMLALIVFGSLAIFPSLLIPSSPSMWIAGMTFGYCYGFLLIIGAVSIGVSIPYFTGSLFCFRLHAWLERYPKRASIIRLAGEGDWFNQFRAVTLIRISPFPYIVYNYCAMATDVKYGPYLLGTIVGMVPEIFVALYTGILIRTLADASHGRHSMSALEIVFNVFGFCVTVATTVIVTVYAKRRLNELQTQEEPLLK